MTIREKLDLILEQALLSDELKAFWQEAFKYLKPEQIMVLVDILEKSKPEEIQELSLNLKEKIRAFEEGNKYFWQDIIKKEKMELS